jgi:hypothetical protein
MDAKIIKTSTKKLVMRGNGLALWVTREARKLGWKPNTDVDVILVKNGAEEFIEIRQAKKSKK